MAGQLDQLGDPQIVELCIEGDSAAWGELVRRYSALVFSIARRMGLPVADAEDVSQRVFSSLVGSLPALKDRQSLAKWLITVSHRESWRHVRRKRDQAGSGGMEAVALLASPTPEESDGWLRRQAVRTALDQMNDRCRDLLRALFFETGSPDYAEISRRLSMPVGSIGPTRNRCLQKLAEALRASPEGADLWEAPEPSDARS